jgi:hypothetical protein
VDEASEGGSVVGEEPHVTGRKNHERYKEEDSVKLSYLTTCGAMPWCGGTGTLFTHFFHCPWRHGRMHGPRDREIHAFALTSLYADACEMSCIKNYISAM